ncbi:MAG: hypothetical protein KQH63_21960 [Desulfobulbaceae bacterium]|nr:hypothetical protein [Desulfobulbaceae bacterium]
MKISAFIPALALLLTTSSALGGITGTVKDTLYDSYGIDFIGFLEARNGWRLQNDDHEKDVSLAEMRMQLEFGKYLGWGELKIKGDLVADVVTHDYTGELRDLNLLFTPFDFMDVKVGRQILTWGTGDLLFVNDLFPKDWKSFFIGRDDEYLKAPSDALKMSFFFSPANIDLVYVPVFNGSSYIDGERLSYWNGLLGETAGRNYIFGDEDRVSFGRDSEYAIRAYRNLSGTEIALYNYYGFWSTPEGQDPDSLKLVYPRLSVYGASARGTLWGGVANLEAGYYDSRQDDDGDNPMVRNSEYRLLAGFEREIGQDFTGAVQYYLEWMEDYDDYKKSLPPGSPAKDERRNVLTLRLTKLLMNQNLKLSFFAYFSPTDKDAYLRPKLNYKITDQLALDVGANIFVGSDEYTFFGQFEDNTNAYAGLRWSF